MIVPLERLIEMFEKQRQESEDAYDQEGEECNREARDKYQKALDDGFCYNVYP